MIKRKKLLKPKMAQPNCLVLTSRLYLTPKEPSVVDSKDQTSEPNRILEFVVLGAF